MNSKTKQQLYKKLNYMQPYENSIKISLLSTYSEFTEILNNIENKTKFLYLDNKAIHDILSKEEEIIQIEEEIYEYSFIYYLSLLIKENKDIVNYDFGIDFIKVIDEKNKNQKNELKKLLVSKIILDLIFNYMGAKTKVEKELIHIKEKNTKYIENNKNFFNNYNLNLKNIEEISLGKLYLDIIIVLITNRKLENYDFAYDILIKLDLENIDINQNLFKELKNILDNEKYINDYKMNGIEDFFVESKINFYYMLIKYIFKNSIFIYNIPLLYNTRKTIIKIIKKEKKNFLSHFNFGNIDLFKRINYNIKFILDSNYYHKIYFGIISQIDYSNNKNNKEYLINLFGEEIYEPIFQNFNRNTEDKIFKKSEIIKTDELNENNTKDNYSEIKSQNNIENEDLNLSYSSSKFITMDSKKITHNYNFEQKKISNEEKLANCILKNSKVILNTKKEGEKLFFIFENISYGDHHISVSYEKLLEIKEYLKKFENIISNSFIKYMDFLEEFKDKIIKEFKLEYKLKIGLEFKIIDKDEKNDSVFNINCLYKIYSSNLDNNIFKEENILLNKTNSNTQGFIYLINEIKENNYDGIKFLKNAKKEIKKASGNNNNDPNNRDNPKTSNFSNETKELNLVSYSKSNEEIGLDLKMRASNYQILKIIGIIGKHENTAEFIKELSNGYYVSGGTDNILKIYDQDFNLKKELNDINEWIYSCFEIEKLSNQNENEYITELILCCNEKLFKIALSFKKEEIKIIGKYLKYKFPQLEIKNCVQMRENNFAIIGQNSYYFIDLFNSKNVQLEKSLIVSEKSYLASIKLNENIIAITSNKVQYKGEDKLIFYNTDKKTIEREIEGYSFTSGINGLALMPREEVKCNNKILFMCMQKIF